MFRTITGCYHSENGGPAMGRQAISARAVATIDRAVVVGSVPKSGSWDLDWIHSFWITFGEDHDHLS